MKKMYLNSNKHIFLNNRRNMYGDNSRRIPPVIICLILAVILLIGALVYYAADVYRKNGLVKTYLSNARSYTETQNYTAAIDEYNKALKTGGTSAAKSEIYRGIVYCYVKNGEIDEAVHYTDLLTARRELGDEDMSNIALTVNSASPSAAYRMLETYLENNKGDGAMVQQLLAYAASAPVLPQLDMLQGTYVKITDLKFKTADEQFGHSIYYTTDGTAPTEQSLIYRGGFAIDETADLRAVSRNSNGELSEIALYSFTVDKDMLEKLEELTAQARELCTNTKTGTDIGQCSQSAKDRLNGFVTDAEQLLKNDNILFMDAENRVDYLTAAIEEFNSKLNTDVDSAKLESMSEFAAEVYSGVSRSSNAKNMGEELSALENAIYAASAAGSDQSDINNAYYTLYQSLLDVNFAGCRSAYRALLVSGNFGSYILYDINDDMIPELILKTQDGLNVLYTYSVGMGEAIKVDNEGNFDKFESFYNSHDGILACTASDTGDFYLITFVGNKIVISDKLEEYNTNETLRTSLEPAAVNEPSNTQIIDAI